MQLVCYCCGKVMQLLCYCREKAKIGLLKSRNACGHFFTGCKFRLLTNVRIIGPVRFHRSFFAKNFPYVCNAFPILVMKSKPVPPNRY